MGHWARIQIGSSQPLFWHNCYQKTCKITDAIVPREGYNARAIILEQLLEGGVVGPMPLKPPYLEENPFPRISLCTNPVYKDSPGVEANNSITSSG